jgi:hypothetical protein
MTNHMPAASWWITHEAETGGGPTGFGWASFVAMMLGFAAIAFMLGRYLQTLAESRQITDDTKGTTSAKTRSTHRPESSAAAAPQPEPTSPLEPRENFDPYDDLYRK